MFSDRAGVAMRHYYMGYGFPFLLGNKSAKVKQPEILPGINSECCTAMLQEECVVQKMLDLHFRHFLKNQKTIPPFPFTITLAATGALRCHGQRDAPPRAAETSAPDANVPPA